MRLTAICFPDAPARLCNERVRAAPFHLPACPALSYPRAMHNWQMYRRVSTEVHISLSITFRVMHIRMVSLAPDKPCRPSSLHNAHISRVLHFAPILSLGALCLHLTTDELRGRLGGQSEDGGRSIAECPLTVSLCTPALCDRLSVVSSPSAITLSSPASQINRRRLSCTTMFPMRAKLQRTAARRHMHSAQACCPFQSPR